MPIRTAALSALLMLSPLAVAGGYNVQVLNFDGYDINVHGEVVGSALDGDCIAYAYKYENGVTSELAPGVASSEAYRVNGSGQIVGRASASDGNSHAALWSGGSLRDLGTLGGTSSFANDITDAGLVVGASNAAVGLHAFVWTEADGMVDYGSQSPNDRNFFAGFNAVNSHGQMTGTAYRLFSPYHASMGQVGTLGVTDIGAPGQYSNSMGLSINESGTMVGYSNGGRGGAQAAILHADGTFEGLGTLGLSESWAMDIDDAGDIVGQAFGPDKDGNWASHAFLYKDGAMTTLESLLPDGSGWDAITDARAINSRGQIVGTGIYHGEYRGFILSPQAVPEPATFAALGLGLAAVARRRRRL